MDRWLGKIAVVTGASAGIGAAISRKLVEEGITVFGFARRHELVDELAREITGKNGSTLKSLRVDITQEDQVVKAFEFIAENFGPVSILVNNAGRFLYDFLHDGDTTKWKQVLDTNVLGLCITTREAVKIMRKNCIDGHIIHINSIDGHKVSSFPGANVYCASKYAVTALAGTLLNELHTLNSKIKVTSLSPGNVETGIMEMAGFPESDQNGLESVKDAPSLKPIDIANAIVYVLATPPHVQVTELTIQPVGEEF